MARWIRRAGRWMRCARAPRASREAMQQGDGDGQGDGPGNRAGRQQSGGNQTDPLGRPLHGREFGDDLTVKIPGEIDVQRVRRILEELRRRLADPQRPQIELDYIERLLRIIEAASASRRQWRARSSASFPRASAPATAARISATENGLVMTSCTMALRPEARSR